MFYVICVGFCVWSWMCWCMEMPLDLTLLCFHYYWWWGRCVCRFGECSWL